MSDYEVKKISDAALPKGTRFIPLVHQFLDQNGDPVDLSQGTWAGQARVEQLHVDAQPAGVGAGTVTIDVPTARATYPWVDADFLTIGRFHLIIWIGNGTQRFGSTVYEWSVADAPGVDPTV